LRASVAAEIMGRKYSQSRICRRIFLVPGIVAAELVFIIPDFEAGGCEGIAEGVCGGAVFSGIADKDARARERRWDSVGGHARQEGASSRRAGDGLSRARAGNGRSKACSTGIEMTEDF